MKTQIKSTLIGGFAGTIVMTIMMLLAPMMGMPEMPIGKMLANFMGMPIAAGWITHFIIGIVLAGMYIFIWKKKLPGSAIVKGIIFSLIPFFMAQLIVMPMMGAGLFSSNMPLPMMLVMGSLVGHLVYGVTLGAVTK